MGARRRQCKQASAKVGAGDAAAGGARTCRSWRRRGCGAGRARPPGLPGRPRAGPTCTVRQRDAIAVGQLATAAHRPCPCPSQQLCGHKIGDDAARRRDPAARRGAPAGCRRVSRGGKRPRAASGGQAQMPPTCPAPTRSRWRPAHRSRRASWAPGAPAVRRGPQFADRRERARGERCSGLLRTRGSSATRRGGSRGADEAGEGSRMRPGRPPGAGRATRHAGLGLADEPKDAAGMLAMPMAAIGSPPSRARGAEARCMHFRTWVTLAGCAGRRRKRRDEYCTLRPAPAPQNSATPETGQNANSLNANSLDAHTPRSRNCCGSHCTRPTGPAAAPGGRRALRTSSRPRPLPPCCSAPAPQPNSSLTKMTITLSTMSTPAQGARGAGRVGGAASARLLLASARAACSRPGSQRACLPLAAMQAVRRRAHFESTARRVCLL